MTNGEKYKKAFSVLQTSKGSLQEVENMAKLQKRTKMKTAAAVIIDGTDSTTTMLHEQLNSVSEQNVQSSASPADSSSTSK